MYVVINLIRGFPEGVWNITDDEEEAIRDAIDRDISVYYVIPGVWEEVDLDQYRDEVEYDQEEGDEREDDSSDSLDSIESDEEAAQTITYYPEVWGPS